MWDICLTLWFLVGKLIRCLPTFVQTGKNHWHLCIGATAFCFEWGQQCKAALQTWSHLGPRMRRELGCPHLWQRKKQHIFWRRPLGGSLCLDHGSDTKTKAGRKLYGREITEMGLEKNWLFLGKLCSVLFCHQSWSKIQQKVKMQQNLNIWFLPLWTSFRFHCWNFRIRKKPYKGQIKLSRDKF